MKNAVGAIFLVACYAQTAMAAAKGPEVACYVTGYQYNTVKKVANNTQREDQYFDNVRLPLFDGTVTDCNTLNKQFTLDHTGVRINVTFTSPCKSATAPTGFLVQMTDANYNYMTAYPVAPDKTQMQSYFVSMGKTFDLQILCAQN